MVAARKVVLSHETISTQVDGYELVTLSALPNVARIHLRLETWELPLFWKVVKAAMQSDGKPFSALNITPDKCKGVAHDVVVNYAITADFFTPRRFVARVVRDIQARLHMEKDRG